MSNQKAYSFNATISEGGCIYLPDDVWGNLFEGQKVSISLTPTDKKEEVTSFELDTFDISFHVLRNKEQIYKRLSETVAIEEDYGFLIHFYSPRNDDFNYLETPQLVGVLMKLYGQPDTFYDDYKCSFNYTFDFKLTYTNEEPPREVKLVMKIFDYKDSLYIQFRRPREGKGDNVLKLIEDVVKRVDLNFCIIMLHEYFCGFFKGYGDNPYDKFERYQPYLKIKYGYDGSKFFIEKKREEENEDEDEDKEEKEQ